MSPPPAASGKASKKMCITDNKEMHHIEGFSAIVESINKFIIEAKEDRLNVLTELIKELVNELQKACLGTI